MDDYDMFLPRIKRNPVRSSPLVNPLAADCHATHHLSSWRRDIKLFENIEIVGENLAISTSRFSRENDISKEEVPERWSKYSALKIGLKIWNGSE